jgi:uncharacterized 2Fe-2S/4Fe-4S cluster protein (DUF4445 family)
VLSGALPVTPEQEHMLSPEELRAGWRLSCQCSADADLTLELAQWEASILSDETAFTFKPKPGLGIAVDLGTTTLVAQLLDLPTGNVLAVRTALNSQARHGADIMSRVGYAVTESGYGRLTELIRRQIGKMIVELLEATTEHTQIADVVLVGNTVMHHLFCGLDLTPLSRFPFESETLGACTFSSKELGWDFSAPLVRFLPCIGGFVGSDILAGVFARRIHESDRLVGLIDLGTNGEILFGTRRRMICASTAAGPAFEGARIYMGMRAATGAISEVHTRDQKLVCHVLGNVTPRGICGSGLVDAIAASLDLGIIEAGGRLSKGGNSLTLLSPVKISQTDIRELQLAKGAIAAGVQILLRDLGAEPADVSEVYLAGAFGNYVNITSAQRIGLLPLPQDRIVPAGNTALLGAKKALYAEHAEWLQLSSRIEHYSLSGKPDFQEIYVENMNFPGSEEHQ